MQRCVNIDWLEVYALEPMFEPRNADYFRAAGWTVQEREYGTPMYHEMFTLEDNFGYAVIEIRRRPKSLKDQGGLFDANGCHVRLTNRACYFDKAAKFLADFLLQNQITFVRISRLDVCLDLKRFDSHDYPADFIRRYMQGKFAKINQARLTAHGEDTWAERCWNSLSWGSKNSPIRTRFYCKSQELQEVKDKPYIRQAWFAAGLVDNPVTCAAHNPDGSVYYPKIWRLEFQISSSVKRWFVIHPDGDETKYLSIHHTLDRYYTREQIQQCIEGLIRHYFHFKYFDSTQRKDRCRDKVLFRFMPNDSYYQIARDSIASTATPDNADRVLLNRLRHYQQTHIFDKRLRNASQIIIDALEDMQYRYTTATPFNREHLTALRLAISRRIQGKTGQPVALEREILDTIQTTLDDLFLEHD